MAVVDGQLYFAPGVLMRDLNLDDPDFRLWAFEQRVKGLFLAPIRTLEQSSDAQEGALFGAALLVAALVEATARVETGSTAQGTLIREWLQTHIDAFRATVVLRSGRSGVAETKSIADVFEHRFRNGLAHNGYVASLGAFHARSQSP